MNKNIMSKQTVPHLVGTHEVADILGWDKAKVSVYMRREDDRNWPGKLLPKPIQILASGPVWRKSDIEKFRDSPK